MIPTEKILSILKQPHPVSIIRVGDAECLVLDMVKSKEQHDFTKHDVFYKQTGLQMSDTDMMAVRDNLIDAISKADILGLPIQGQKPDPQWDRIRGAIKEHIPTHTELWCDIDIHGQMLANGNLKELIEQYGELTYISCRNLDDKFGVPVNSFITAPEFKFTSTYTGPVHYPDQYNEIKKWMTSLDAKNNLLLYGSGVFGKQYGNWWRDMGGIAFDAGSVFDEWAGRITRGDGRGIDVTGGKYTL